jgi:hypothetical protein
MGPGADFKRMVLGLPHSANDYAAVAFTAELAALLGLDLLGIFAQDEKLVDLALLPCVREFRIAGDGWHRLDVKQLEENSIQAAADARRLFANAAKALRGGARLDLVKGQIGEIIGMRSMPDDIIVVIEPKNPAERVTLQFRRFIDMALSAPTATLLIPSRIIRRKGPVVAIAANEGDLSIPVGLRVAEAAREKLLVLTPDVTDDTFLARPPSTAAVEYRLLPASEVGLAELASALALAGERLLVMGRGSNNLFPSQVAFERGIPVLVTAERERCVD